MTLDLDAASKRLLKMHLLHRGLNKRIAKALRVDPSYVSKVASGIRSNAAIMEEILRELRAIQNSK
jgi:hypothetical protein